MSNHVITIGTISLQDFEVPTSLQFGGRQRLVVHRMSDGRRMIEPLGPDDAEIIFQGIFSGEHAEARARALDDLRLSGNAVWLVWSSFRYKVIVETFTAVYHSRWWISYRISCIVVHQRGVASSSILTTQAIISSALSSAAVALIDAGIDLSPLSSAVGAAGALTTGTASNLEAVTVAGALVSQTQAQIDLQSAALTNYNSNPRGAARAASTFRTVVECSGSLAKAVNAKSYIQLVNSNLDSWGD